jgi:hypothetical protein
MISGELDAALSRPRYGRRAGHEDSGVAAVASGDRHGSRVRTLTGTFGKTKIAVPRARLNTSLPPDGPFGTVVIDPPWQMEKIDRDERPNQAHSNVS